MNVAILALIFFWIWLQRSLIPCKFLSQFNFFFQNIHRRLACRTGLSSAYDKFSIHYANSISDSFLFLHFSIAEDNLNFTITESKKMSIKIFITKCIFFLIWLAFFLSLQVCSNDTVNFYTLDNIDPR